MPNTYAVITNGKVSACFLGDDVFAQQYYPGSIRIDNLNPVPGIGWSYANGAFTAPPAPTPPPPTNPVYAKLDFLSLFTDAEQQALANYSNATLSGGVTMKQMNQYQQLLNATVMVDLTDPRTITGLNLLATAGLITPARRDAILASRH